jgi:hypothetical protein
MTQASHPDEIPDVVPEFPDRPPPDPTKLSQAQAAEMRGVLAEILARRREALKIFRPMPTQEAFFASDAGDRIAIGGNRSGKTTVSCIEIARAVTGQDPHDKYPKTNGTCILVGLDLTHCSKVFYKKLFKPGAFRIIKDEITGESRPFVPDDPDDARRVYDSKPAPPLIPKRFYEFKKIAWENKKDEIPKTIPLKNGWSIHFFSSKGAPPQGWNVDLVGFDEEIEHPLWYPEMSARLLDNRTVDPITGKVRSGKFIWSATPQTGTQILYDLASRAEKWEGEPNAPIAMFEFGMLDNKYVADAAKQEFMAKFADNPDELAVRVHGKFALLGSRVYSEFAPRGAHGCETFIIPDDWTVYCAIDPGRQVCAVLFAAVPPPRHEMHGQLVIFDELYIKRCNAQIFADTFVQRVSGRPIEFGIIDHRAGRMTEIASGRTPEEQYTAALKAKRFAFEKGGTSFVWGADDVKAGIQEVHNALHIVDGKPRLVVMREKVPSLLWEMERYSYRKLPSGLVTDEPVKMHDHLCDCVRYLASAKLKYVKPRPRKAKGSYTNELLAAKKERAKFRKKQESGYGGAIKVG